jgi:ABC-type phosphate/phosphonate transport system substrate-binding protein
MTYLRLVLVILLVFYSIVFSVHAQQQTLNIVYLENGLKDLNKVDKLVALNLLAKEFIKGSDTDTSLVAVNSIEEMIDSIKQGKVHYGILNSYYYLAYSEQLKPFMGPDLWKIQRSFEEKEDYVLVVNKNIDYIDIKSLAGKRLSVHQDYLMMNFYLKYWIKKTANQPVEKFFKSIKNTKTASQSVLDVFFNTSDVCIVPEYILNLVRELNPAINNDIKVVHHSGANFIPALVLTFNYSGNAYADKVRNNLGTLTDTVRGQEILNLFNIKNITPAHHDSLTYMFDIFNEYALLETNHKYVHKAQN